MQKNVMFFVFALMGLLLNVPAFAQAQQSGLQFSQLLLSCAIVIGSLCSIYVFVLAGRLAGGRLGSALFFYGLGMLAVVVSLLSVTWLKPLMGEYTSEMHDLCFILGFILMAIATSRIAKMN